MSPLQAPSPHRVMRGSQLKQQGHSQPENNGAGVRGESVGFPGCLVVAINLITSRSPRLPLSLPKASAGFAADSHMARKALKPPAVFLMGAVTNLALRHQLSNQIFYWYLLRTHLGSMGFGINRAWRGPRDGDLGSPRDTLVLPTVTASSERQAWLWTQGSLPQPQPVAGHTLGNTAAYPEVFP